MSDLHTSVELPLSTLTLTLTGTRAEVHAPDGRLLFFADSAGLVAPFDWVATENCMVWEDTNTTRVELSRAVTALWGLPLGTSERSLRPSLASTCGGFFLPRQRPVRGAARHEGEAS